MSSYRLYSAPTAGADKLAELLCREDDKDVFVTAAKDIKSAYNTTRDIINSDIFAGEDSYYDDAGYLVHPVTGLPMVDNSMDIHGTPAI
ncbi:MAG: hypothetical protein ACTJGL_05230 [Vreelandella alkaliphila]